jgi:hypothetical protein
VIHAIDKDIKSIKGLHGDFNGVHVSIVEKDFVSEPLELNDMDGFLLANSLHYVKDKTKLFLTLRSSLKPAGGLLVVEYERVTSNPWVPFPIDFEKLKALASAAGFEKITRLAEIPSVFDQVKMYSAVLRC